MNRLHETSKPLSADKAKLAFPRSVYEKIKIYAERNGMTINESINFLLWRGVKHLPKKNEISLDNNLSTCPHVTFGEV